MVRPQGRFRSLGVEVAQVGTTRKRANARRSSIGRSTVTRTSRGRGRTRRRAGARRIASLGFSVPRWFPRLGALDQRGRDVLGLACVAVGVFMGFVLYGGWNGGRAGHAMVVALGWVLGRARVLAPITLIAGGGALLLRPVLPALRPLRAGAICLFASVTLALAAGTLGVSAAPGARDAQWTSAFLQAHGGVVGEALYQATHRLVGNLGVDILGVFLLLVGVILLTGASLAGTIRATGNGLIETTRKVRALAGPRPHAMLESGPRAPDGDDAEDFPAERALVSVPEPALEELIVRATHVEAPSQNERAELGRRKEDGMGIDRSQKGDAHSALRAGSPEALGAMGPVGNEVEEEHISGVARADPGTLTPQGRLRDAATDDPDFVWELPNAVKLLMRSTGEQARPDTAGQERVATSLVEALGHFGVQAKVIGNVVGPHITRYELRLAPGTKVAKVAQLKDDLAYALAATDIRILAPIPGKQAVGVEVPNAHRRIVRLGDVFQDPPKEWSPLTVWLGKDVAGKAIGADLAKMPHLLVAGTTGAGKSGAINAMLSSVLLRATPHDVRLVLVDPKQVELNHYESIPHLLTPVITSPRMAANALQNLVKEMEQRYGIMSMARTRSLIELNRARAKRKRGSAAVHIVRDRRARGSDDGGARGRRGLDHPPGAEGARGGYPSGPRDTEPAGGRDHRDDQGECAVADRVLGLLPDRFARDPRSERRRVAAGSGGHAVQPRRQLAAAAHPGGLHRRGPDREVDRPVAAPGRAGAARGAPQAGGA